LSEERECIDCGTVFISKQRNHVRCDKHKKTKPTKSLEQMNRDWAVREKKQNFFTHPWKGGSIKILTP